MSIRLLKLITGEEILGDVEDKSDYVVVKNPFSIIFIPTQQGMQIMLKPYWENHVDKPDVLHVKNNHILMPKVPVQQMLDMYHKVTSPIDLPPKGLVL